MTAIAKIKPLCRDIIVTYTQYVRGEVHKGRVEYLQTGINDNIEVYKELFLEILGLTLGVSDKEPKINTVVKQETIEVIKKKINSRKYYKILKVYRLMIYTTCNLIFERVVQDIKENNEK